MICRSVQDQRRLGAVGAVKVKKQPTLAMLAKVNRAAKALTPHRPFPFPILCRRRILHSPRGLPRLASGYTRERVFTLARYVLTCLCHLRFISPKKFFQIHVEVHFKQQ